MRVLIIEDELWLGEQFQSVLQNEGFDTTLTSNVYSAIDLIDEQKPSVIVMSLLLSGASGIGLLHELQSYVDTAATPVVVYSDTQATVSVADMEPYGVRRLLDVTTLKPQDLVGVVRSVLA